MRLTPVVLTNFSPRAGSFVSRSLTIALLRSSADFVSGRAVSHGGEAFTFLEGVDQTSIRQSPVGGLPDRLLQYDHPGVVAGTSFFTCIAEFGVGVGGCFYNLGRSRLVGRVERDIAR